MVRKPLWPHPPCRLFLCAVILYCKLIKCWGHCCWNCVMVTCPKVWQALWFVIPITQFKITLVVLTLVLFCFSGWESDLQKCRNNCRQSKVRGQVMEPSLHRDNTVWKRIWADWTGGAGFIMLSLFVCCCWCCSHQMIAMHFATMSVCFTNVFLFSMHLLKCVQSV